MESVRMFVLSFFALSIAALAVVSVVAPPDPLSQITYAVPGLFVAVTLALVYSRR